MPTNLIEVEHLTKHFPRQGGAWGQRRGVVRAVDDISFTVLDG